MQSLQSRQRACGNEHRACGRERGGERKWAGVGGISQAGRGEEKGEGLGRSGEGGELVEDD